MKFIVFMILTWNILFVIESQTLKDFDMSHLKKMISKWTDSDV